MSSSRERERRGIGLQLLVPARACETRYDPRPTATTTDDPTTDDRRRPTTTQVVRRAVNGGFTAESVTWALKNANSAEFSSPMISIHGRRDGLLGLEACAEAYRSAVEAYGKPDLHRLYVLESGGHVDLHSDGATLDYDFDGMPGEEGVADLFTPMQPYVERAFDYLVEWAEQGSEPPADMTGPTQVTGRGR